MHTSTWVARFPTTEVRDAAIAAVKSKEEGATNIRYSGELRGFLSEHQLESSVSVILYSQLSGIEALFFMQRGANNCTPAQDRLSAI